MDAQTYLGTRMKYVSEVVDPMMEDLMHDLLTTLPQEPVDFTIDWLRRRRGYQAESSGPRLSLQAQNQILKQDLQQATKAVVTEVSSAIKPETTKADESGSDDDSEEDDDDDDEIEDLPPPPKKTGPRASVSAEAYGAWNKVVQVELPVYKKTPEQRQRLLKILSLSFLFSSLEDKELDVILDAFEEREFNGDRIIKEGDDGDCLYICEQGTLQCMKIINGAELNVKTCGPGDVFGELALLYNCPRAASVDADGQCVCWRLDRQTFTQIIKESATSRSEKYDKFVQSVSLFATMEANERSKIVDCLKIERYVQGDIVVRQGEAGDRFYVVEEGDLVATKAMPGEAERVVMKYGNADYFGELALLKNQPRGATIKVTSAKAKLVWLDRKTFTKILGPLQGILERQAAKYG